MSVLEFLLLSVIAITGFVGPLLMVRVRGHARAFAAMLIADCVLAIVSLLGLRDGAADAWPELGGVVAVGGALFLLVIPWALRRLGGFAASRGRLRWARRLADVRELLQPGMGAGVERQLLATLEKINQGKSQEVVDELLTARAAARNENERLHVDEQIVLILAYACRWQDAIHHYHAQLVSRPANRVSQLDVEMIRAHHEVSDIDGAARCLARLEEFGNGAPEWLRNQARLVFLSFAGRWEAVERLVARLHRAGFLPKPGLAYWSGLARVRGGDVARGRALLLGAVRGGDGRSRSCAQAEIARLDRGENPRDVWDAQAKQLLDKVEASIALMPDLGTAMPTGGPRRSVATASLLAANVAVAIAAWAALGDTTESTWHLIRLGANYKAATAAGQWWRLVSAMFVHIGWMHLVVNMLGLWMLGRIAEGLLGTARTLVTYMAAGLVGSLATTWSDAGTLSAGASGAVLGLLAAIATELWRHRTHHSSAWSRQVRGQLVFLAALNIAVGFLYPMIDQAGHLGGLAGGALASWLLSGSWRSPRVKKLVLRFGSVVTILLFVAAAWATLFTSVVETVAVLPRATYSMNGLSAVAPKSFERAGSAIVETTMQIQLQFWPVSRGAGKELGEQDAMGLARYGTSDGDVEQVRIAAQSEFSLPAPWTGREFEFDIQLDGKARAFRSLVASRDVGTDKWIVVVYFKAGTGRYLQRTLEAILSSMTSEANQAD